MCIITENFFFETYISKVRIQLREVNIEIILFLSFREDYKNNKLVVKCILCNFPIDLVATELLYFF